MHKLAIIGGGITAADYIDACNRIGYEPHYFSMSDGVTQNTDLAIFHEINIFDRDEIVKICIEVGVDGVVPTTELTVPIAAYVADKLNVAGNSPNIAEVITDKLRNRDCIAGLHLLKSPKYAEVSTFEDVVNCNFRYPIILKPKNLGGKRGLSVVRSERELGQALEYAHRSFPIESDHKIIVEEFLEGGIECSVESISIDGIHYIIQITEKVSSGAPHCVELAHHQPAAISKEERNNVVEAVKDGLTAVGLTIGACHTEIKIMAL